MDYKAKIAAIRAEWETLTPDERSRKLLEEEASIDAQRDVEGGEPTVAELNEIIRDVRAQMRAERSVAPASRH